MRKRPFTKELRLPTEGAPFTLTPVSVPQRTVHLNAVNAAEFLRLPSGKAGARDPIYNLSRGKWNSLILPCKANGFKPPIKSVSQRNRGALRGVRMISADSARAYFQNLLAEQEGGNG